MDSNDGDERLIFLREELLSDEFQASDVRSTWWLRLTFRVKDLRRSLQREIVPGFGTNFCSGDNEDR